MTRPGIVRADTIDLQDHDAPSAKDHSKHLAPNSATPAPLAPHQAETLREVAHETAAEESRSPRTSFQNGEGVEDLQQYVDDLAAGVSGAAGSGGKMASKQQDDLAIAQNGGASSDEDMDDDEDYDDDLMDKISSSPSIEDEDIDFEFVYALHTFVATVEGQANATKGDTMVLLDDSNSYWWLVRVVKDSSIGYLPAEHIETPTERLARLNKHRNIDLSATMLGDQAQKQKSTFKSIRRRKKTVTFTDPTYVDYSDFDYSSDEEDIEELFGNPQQKEQQKESQREATEEQDAQQQQQKNGKSEKQEAQATVQPVTTDIEVADETAKVEPLKPRAKKEAKMAEPTEDTIAEEEEDEERPSEELESRPDGVSRSKNGTVRNTDSFYRDESVETKKITLTPNLLRDDNQPRPSTDSLSKEAKTRPSLDKLEKDSVFEKDKKKGKKDDRREKDKKPSAIRNFFSRKDRKKSEDDDELYGKRSMDLASEPRDSEDVALDEPASPEKQQSTTQRQTGKLQKPQPRAEPSPAQKAAATQRSQRELNYLAEGRTNDVSNVPPASMRIVDPDTQETQEVPSNQHQPVQERAASAAAQRDDRAAAQKNVWPRSASAAPDSRPQKTIKAQTRMDLDESDSDEAEAALAEPTQRSLAPDSAPGKLKQTPSRPHMPGAFPDSFVSQQTLSNESIKTLQPTPLSVNTEGKGGHYMDAGEVSPMSPDTEMHPPGLMADASPMEGRSPETSPSLEPVQPVVSATHDTASAGPAKEHAWDDEKLRMFFDQGDHVRDLLAVVYDKTDVVPVGMDHPVMGGLFREQNAKLAEITTQLDNMLGDWLARKQRLRGTA